MLRRLHIRNYLLIESLDLGLDDGLTIITGETGSGKSILIGALALAMGERAEAGVLRDPSERCVIELEVDLGHVDLEPWFATHELPFEGRTIMRRQLEPGGRSRAFINSSRPRPGASHTFLPPTQPRRRISGSKSSRLLRAPEA